MDSQYLVYDIECFKYDTLYLFKTLDNNIYRQYWISHEDTEEQRDETAKRLYEEVVKDHVLVGYNNYYYDDVMLTKGIYGSSQRVIHATNNALISGNMAYPNIDEDIKSLDCMQQIDISRPSLKQIEGNFGKSIIESTISFDLDRPLTPSEKREVLKYCSYDIETTIKIFKMRKESYFDIKKELVDMLPEDIREKAMKWNTTTITANLLVPDVRRYTKMPPKMPCLDDLWGKGNIPTEVWKMWEIAKIDEIPKGQKVKVLLFGCEFVFGFGGLHGAPVKSGRYKNVHYLDVASMYPSIIVLLYALGESTEIYEAIRQERVSIKKSDPMRAGVLKLILNSAYGLLKAAFSKLYNPYASSAVCIYGQIALFTLCERLHNAGYRIINANTDGVAFDDPNGNEEYLGDMYIDIWHEWEKEFSLQLDYLHYDLWIQRDVNNYVATQGDSIKTKGGELNKALNDLYFKNNSARIIQMALLHCLLNIDQDDLDVSYKKTVRKYLLEHTDRPELFMYVLKCGSTYKGTYDDKGNLLQKVNRVFALSNNPKYDKYATQLRKVKEFEGSIEDAPFGLFPLAPIRQFLWNDDVDKIENFREMIDLKHYEKVVLDKLEEFICT